MTEALAWTRARPIGSLLAAGLAAAALVRYGLSAHGLIAAFMCGILVVLSVIDIESHRLPNKIVLPSAGIVLVARLASAPEHWQAWLGAGLGGFAFFLAFTLIYPAGLGMGDVKLALLLGFALGSAVLPALLVGTLAGGAAGIILLAKNGSEARRRAIPFGPFLAFGAIAILLLSAP
jgi:leader peptidase (prepilin peptidase) / N-methyltransferase